MIKNALKTVQHNTEFLGKLRLELESKAQKDIVDGIQENMQNYCRYDEMKALYNKVLPKLAQFDKLISKYDKDHKQQKDIIKRYDEVMSQKANKLNLIEIEKKAYEKYAPK